MTNLSNISDIATQEQNTTGTMTPILTIGPEDGTFLKIVNRVARGDEIGVPIYAGLLDSGGNPLPDDTRMALRFEAPADDGPTVVSVPLENIRAYNDLSIQEQQNEEYVDRVKHQIKGEALGVRDVDKMEVAIESSAQIDWSQTGTRMEFEPSAVTISG